MFLPWKWRGSALTLGYGQQHSVWFGIKEKQIFLERMLCGLWCVFLRVVFCFVFEKRISCPVCCFQPYFSLLITCVVNDHLLCWELPPTAPSRMPTRAEQHCFMWQERPGIRCAAVLWASTELSGLEIFWLLCDFMDRPVSSKARLLFFFFLKTKLQLFVSACCSESWAGYKTLCSFQSHYW